MLDSYAMILNLLAIVGSLAMVVFFLGFCIFIHEFGHLVVALAFGLHVERFSIGFGKRIWGFHYRGVDFRVSLLPLGGYVALPQLEPTDQPMDEAGNPLPKARPVARMATAAAGPMANILFGFVLATFLWAVALPRPVPMAAYEVHAVAAESPEQLAGLEPGDRIVAVNDKPVPSSWQGMIERIVLGRRTVTLGIERDGEARTVEYRQIRNEDVEGLGFPNFDVVMPVAALVVNPGSPADLAGILPGDLFLEVNGERVVNDVSFILAVRGGEGAPVDLVVQRGEQVLAFEGVVPLPQTFEGQVFHVIGVRPGMPEAMLHVGPWQQFTEVLARTGHTLRALFRRDSLVSARHMSGPIGIVSMNYVMVRDGGWRQGLSFVVLVTFSLAMLNLLPVPVLDGGHIVFGVIEGVSGRRIPSRVAYAMQMFFAIALLCFILYVSFFDVKRVARFFIPAGDDPEEAAPAGPQPGPDPGATGEDEQTVQD